MSSESIASDPPLGEGHATGGSRTTGSAGSKKVNYFTRIFRSLFGYRKTTLTFLVFATFLATIAISSLDNTLDYSVSLPEDEEEKAALNYSWSCLQEIGATQHTYTSRKNDRVHDFLEKEIAQLIEGVDFIEYDNDLNYTNSILFAVKYLSYDSVSYYESNNLLVRINGSDDKLPALLLSSHYDSVPTSYGVTDDGMGVASMLGLLKFFAANPKHRPARTIIFNFNNNEEFGLYGAHAFLSHPWFNQIAYFLNLEGTGAGGKAVLFRGTDYGIINHFSSVRFPFATSLFQQGFNNRLIHSETDYSVYKDKGSIRGLDLAFYKPRDLYHTPEDNIRHTSIKSLWHMLSCALDFSVNFTNGAKDLDADLTSEPDNKSLDFAAYTSFMNHFFAAPISTLIVANITLLCVVPFTFLFFFFIILKQKKSWNLNFLNIIKFPLSLAFSVTILFFFTDVFVIPYNQFLVNNSLGSLTGTLFATFMLLNYAFLNGFNWLFKHFKGHQHDEKLIIIIQQVFILWVILLLSTIKLTNNDIGKDHTGELLIPVLYLLMSVSGLIGLMGWSFKKSTRHKIDEQDESSEPLLGDHSANQYGSNEEECMSNSTSSSFKSREFLVHCAIDKQSFSYDWLIQYLVLAPISSYVIYNSGFLIMEGISKSVQESRNTQDLIYTYLKTFAVAWAVPFLPFIFKVNRIMVLVLILVFINGIATLSLKSAFDASNPMKLRFMETMNLDASPISNTVKVSGRLTDLVGEILRDIPSVKKDNAQLEISQVGDGMLMYTWQSSLLPKLPNGIEVSQDFLDIEILKNSTSASDAPFGMLTGEIKIRAPENRNCKVVFSVADSIAKIFEKEADDVSPVKSVTIYNHEKSDNSTKKTSTTRFKDHFYKNYGGIQQLQLNKLDWSKPYHIGFQWVPETVEAEIGESLKVKVRKLRVAVECYWSELETTSQSKNGEVFAMSTIPAYSELLKYSPDYVTWANLERGLFSVQKVVEL